MANVNQGVLDGLRRIGAKVRDLTVDGGVPGAPLGFRLRGATQSGPPQTGTWKAGDQVPDRTGVIWICTAGGTGPAATWIQSGMPVTATVAAFLAQPGARMLGHRGLSQVAPEDTMTAFRSAIQAMSAIGQVPALKIDAWKLADGAFGVMHDNTVTRTTTSTGNVASYTSQTWQTLLFNSSLVGPAWGSVSIPLLTDVLDQLGGKCVLMIDVKDGTSAACSAILAEITARGLKSSCILCHEDIALAMPALCQAAGVGFMYYWNANAIASAPIPATVAATPGVTGLGIAVTNAEFGGTSYTDSDISTVAATAAGAGLVPYGFSYTRRYHYTRALSLGLTMSIADDLYVATTTPARTSDLFSVGAPIPGEVGCTFPGTAAVEAPSYQYAGGAGNYRRAMTGTPNSAGIYECLGFLGPAANSGGGIYTLGGTVFWDAAETGNSLGDRFAAIFVGCTDDSFTIGNATVNGYNCLIRQGNGSTYASPTFQVFKQVRGAYQNNGTWATGTSAQVGSNQTNTTGYAAPNTLGASYSSGAAITSLTLGSAVTIPAGMKIALPNGQIATVSGAVTASATVAVTSITLTSALTSGQAVSFGIPFTVKVDGSVAGTTTITFKRTDTNDTLTAADSSSPWDGGYCHIGKTGVVSSSTLAVSYAGLSIS